MTNREPLPRPPERRSTPDRIRRASVADGANGFDAFLPLDWIRETGASVSDTLIAWDRGELAYLPVGKAWDVVRLTQHEGWKAIRQLRRMEEIAVGPVLYANLSVEVPVPVNSADGWDLPGASVLQSGEFLRVPPMSMVAPRTLEGHSWIITPSQSLVLTDTEALYRAYSVALVAAAQAKDASL